jgi:hypothetical protein
VRDCEKKSAKLFSFRGENYFTGTAVRFFDFNPLHTEAAPHSLEMRILAHNILLLAN